MMLLPLLLALPALGAGPPQPSASDRAFAALAGQLSREIRVELATHLPGLFRPTFLCQLRPTGGQPSTLLPGDWIDTPEGANLFCPGGYGVSLARQSRVLLSELAGGPALFLERGALTAAFGRAPLVLGTPTLELRLAGLGSGQRVSLTPELVECSLGSVAADFEPVGDDTPQTLFGSGACRMELALNGGAIKRYLLSGERVRAANLALPRRFWPRLGPPPGASQPPQAPAGISLLPATGAQAADSSFKAAWSLPPWLGPGASCQVFAQPTDAHAAEPISTFQAESAQGDLVLDGSYRGQALSMVCENAQGAAASNLLLETAPPAP